MDREMDFEEASASAVERRRRPRYLCSLVLTIRPADGVAMRGISVEMSESGMSAMASGLLKVGEAVELEPVAGGTAPAAVRHKLGQLYGFEFIGLTADQAARIAENCKKLGRYRSQARGA